VGGGHSDAGADAKICENQLSLYLYIRKIAGGRGSIVNCCLPLYLNIAGVRQGPGKMPLGS